MQVRQRYGRTVLRTLFEDGLGEALVLLGKFDLLFLAKFSSHRRSHHVRRARPNLFEGEMGPRDGGEENSEQNRRAGKKMRTPKRTIVWNISSWARSDSLTFSEKYSIHILSWSRVLDPQPPILCMITREGRGERCLLGAFLCLHASLPFLPAVHMLSPAPLSPFFFHHKKRKGRRKEGATFGFRAT